MRRIDETKVFCRYKKFICAAALDKLLGAAVILMPYLVFGAYIRFEPYMVILGVSFLILTAFLRKRSDKRFCAVTAAILRVICAAAAVAFFIIAGNRLSGVKAFYPIQKAAYIYGNFKETDFSFLPDKIPENSKDFKMVFRAQLLAQADTKLIILSFTADDNGVSQVRSLAESYGACEIADAHRQTAALYEMGYDCSGCEVYGIPSDDTDDTSGTPDENISHTPFYFINEQSGVCIIYW